MKYQITTLTTIIAAIGLTFFASVANAQGASMENGAIVERGSGGIATFTLNQGPVQVRYDYVAGPGDLFVAPPGRELNWFSNSSGPDALVTLRFDLSAIFGGDENWVDIAQGFGHIAVRGECDPGSEDDLDSCLIGTNGRFQAHGYFEALEGDVVPGLLSYDDLVLGVSDEQCTDCNFRIQRVLKNGDVKLDKVETTPR